MIFQPDPLQSTGWTPCSPPLAAVAQGLIFKSTPRRVSGKSLRSGPTSSLAANSAFSGASSVPLTSPQPWLGQSQLFRVLCCVSKGK